MTKRAKAPKVERPRTGAPTKCDEVLTALVVKRIAAGAPVPVACAAEGVSRQNLEQWRKRADMGNAACLTFLAAVERAHARFISQRVVNIAAAGFAAGDTDAPAGGDWKADAWLAERMDPEHFAAQQVLLVKAQEAASDDVLSMLRGALSPSAWAEVVAALRRGDGDDEAEHVEH